MVLMVSLLPALACRSGGPTHLPTERERVEMLSLMLPASIRIEPFTTVRSFNQDDVPDGILMVVRPLDRFGDPVKAAGLFYFELWTFVNASAERKGERLAFWDRMIASKEEVELYWTHGQMYEFQLAWTAGVEGLVPDRKYILTATYRTPWDETIQDEYELEFHPTFESILPAANTPPPPAPPG
ncbi:MAG: hypothetical protein AMXMBFR13_14130 [Phycisphaerae bacterium]